MIDCPECTEIKARRPDWFKERKVDRPYFLQCETCGAWWRYNMNICNPDGFDHYRPVLCRQKRCTEQAVFKDPKRGVKRRWKCRAHAGE